jgi:hypothetical protein
MFTILVFSRMRPSCPTAVPASRSARQEAMQPTETGKPLKTPPDSPAPTSRAQLQECRAVVARISTMRSKHAASRESKQSARRWTAGTQTGRSTIAAGLIGQVHRLHCSCVTETHPLAFGPSSWRANAPGNQPYRGLGCGPVSAGPPTNSQVYQTLHWTTSPRLAARRFLVVLVMVSGKRP